MSGPRRSVTGAVTAALAQTAVAVAAHTVASGCLPSTRGAVTAIPAVVAAVLILDRVVRGRPLLALAGGQLSAHAVLAVVAACAAAGNSAASHEAGVHPELVMTVAHLVGFMLLRAVLGYVVTWLEQAVAVAVAGSIRLARWVVRRFRCLTAPTLRAHCGARQGSMSGRVLPRAVPARGPPRCLPLPA